MQTSIRQEKKTTYARTMSLSALPKNTSPTPQCISSQTPPTPSVDTLTAGAQKQASPATVVTSTNTSKMTPSAAPSSGPRTAHSWYLRQKGHMPQRGALHGLWKTSMDLHADVLCAHPIPAHHPRRNPTLRHSPYRPTGTMPCKPA